MQILLQAELFFHVLPLPCPVKNQKHENIRQKPQNGACQCRKRNRLALIQIAGAEIPHEHTLAKRKQNTQPQPPALNPSVPCKQPPDSKCHIKCQHRERAHHQEAQLCGPGIHFQRPVLHSHDSFCEHERQHLHTAQSGYIQRCRQQLLRRRRGKERCQINSKSHIGQDHEQDCLVFISLKHG